MSPTYTGTGGNFSSTENNDFRESASVTTQAQAEREPQLTHLDQFRGNHFSLRPCLWGFFWLKDTLTTFTLRLCREHHVGKV